MTTHPPEPAALASPVLLELRNVEVHFPITRGWLRRTVGSVRAVDGIHFSIRQGETLGLVGESGCGKSTTARAIVQIHRPTAGAVLFQGENLALLRGAALRRTRRAMQMIFQDPYASLNPRMTTGAAVAEPVRIHRLRRGSVAVRQRVEELFHLVGLNPAHTRRYPHELSGGQRQRVGIARALAAEPAFIVCDEPVSALDVSIQAQIVNLLQTLQAKLGLTFLFITHDFSVIKHLSNRIAVMYLGKIVELADNENLIRAPLHPYTVALLSAVPVPDPHIEQQRQRIILPGEVPDPAAVPPGCRFHTRCPLAIAQCREEEPPFFPHRPGHFAACWRAHEVAHLMPYSHQ